MKADLLKIESMSSFEILSRVASSIRDELSKVNERIVKLGRELNNRTQNPKWYNYSCEYELRLCKLNQKELTLKLKEVESIIKDILDRGDTQ